MQRGSLKVKLKDGAKWWRAQWREPGAKNATTRWLGRVVDVTRADARAQLDRIVGIANARSAALSGAVTLRKYVEDEYLTVKSNAWKASTRSTTEQIIGTHVLATFGHRMLASITRKELQAHLEEKAAAGLSKSVVGHVRWQLVSIFRMAQSDGLIQVNPTLELVEPRCVKAPAKQLATVDAIRKAEMVLQLRDRLLFSLTVREGLRPGEASALQLGDIRDGMVHVERRIYRGVIDTPKSDLSSRRVGLTEQSRMLLDAYREILADTRPDAWLFPSENGNTPISYANVFRRRIRPALKKIGVNLNFQVLRRTFATELGEVERDPMKRAKIMGHSVNVDDDEYRQQKPEDLRRIAAEVGSRLQ